MNILAQQFEDSPIDQLLMALIATPVSITLSVAWEIARITAIVIAWLFAAIVENWKSLAKLVAIVVAVAIMAMVWQIGIGVGVVVALTMAMKRKGKI